MDDIIKELSYKKHDDIGSMLDTEWRLVVRGIDIHKDFKFLDRIDTFYLFSPNDVNFDKAKYHNVDGSICSHSSGIYWLYNVLTHHIFPIDRDYTLYPESQIRRVHLKCNKLHKKYVKIKHDRNDIRPVNPETGRKIMINGNIFNRLKKRYNLINNTFYKYKDDAVKWENPLRIHNKYFLIWALYKKTKLCKDIIQYEIFQWLDIDTVNILDSCGFSWYLEHQKTFEWTCVTGHLHITKMLWNQCLNNEIGLINIRDSELVTLATLVHKGHIDTAIWLKNTIERRSDVQNLRYIAQAPDIYRGFTNMCKEMKYDAAENLYVRASELGIKLNHARFCDYIFSGCHQLGEPTFKFICGIFDEKLIYTRLLKYITGRNRKYDEFIFQWILDRQSKYGNIKKQPQTAADMIRAFFSGDFNQ